MIKKHANILELNNIDVFGKRFNGYFLQKYINSHPQSRLHVDFLVNQKIGDDDDIAKLFATTDEEIFDLKIEGLEQNLQIKNQISISEDALIRHPLYKRADILHFHMYHNMHLPIEFLARIPKKKKIVIELHDTFWLTDSRIPMLEVFQYADTVNKNSLDAERQRVLNSIDAELIVHSPFLYNLAKTSTTTKGLNIHLINFGIDPDAFKPLPKANLRKKYHIPTDSLVLMCRAQKEFKGLSYIISALKQLHLSQKVTVITVSGVGFLDELKNRYNIIDFGSVQSETTMCELFNLCDIFLAPSTEESFGFMAVEAMSCAKPVIVFEGTALPTTVHAPKIGLDTPRNAKALAKAITYLSSNPNERRKRGQAGREYVLHHYQEQQYYQNYIALFQQLSHKRARKVICPQTSHPPANLPQFLSLLRPTPSELISPISDLDTTLFAVPQHLNIQLFDYNNSSLQQALQQYNHSLYLYFRKLERTKRNILKQESRFHRLLRHTKNQLIRVSKKH